MQTTFNSRIGIYVYMDVAQSVVTATCLPGSLYTYVNDFVAIVLPSTNTYIHMYIRSYWLQRNAVKRKASA